jgi:hypothetical protein
MVPPHLHCEFLIYFCNASVIVFRTASLIGTPA